MNDKMEDFNQLHPISRRVESVGGIGTVDIKELGFRKAAEVMLALGPVLDGIKAGGNVNLTRAMFANPDSIVNAVSAALDVDESVIDSLTAAKTIELAEAVFEANMSFFLRYLVMESAIGMKIQMKTS